MSSNVFVFAEQRDGNVQKVSFELLGKAAELAKNLGQKVYAVLLGSGITGKADILYQYGADVVVVVDDPMLKSYVTEPYAKALAAIIKKYDPEVLIFGATSIGRDLAPRVSARVHTGLTADCTGLEINAESKNLRMTRPAFGGNIMATILCSNHRPQMATVRPGVMQALARDGKKAGTPEKVDVKFDAKDMNVKIVEEKTSDKKHVDITEAKILISGGRGIGKPENFDMLRALAGEMNAEISSSRANVDAGWITRDRQVGQTGKTVRPDLYVACGISGAIQHLAGMEDSESIIAINKNKTAPIFDVADLGIVGDVAVIVPKLAEELKKRKAATA